MMKANTQGCCQLVSCQSVLSLKKIYRSVVLCIAALLISGLLRLFLKKKKQQKNQPQLQLCCDACVLMVHTLIWQVSGSCSLKLGMKNNLSCMVFRGHNTLVTKEQVLLSFLASCSRCNAALLHGALQTLRAVQFFRLLCVLCLTGFISTSTSQKAYSFLVYIVWRIRVKSRNL